MVFEWRQRGHIFMHCSVRSVLRSVPTNFYKLIIFTFQSQHSMTRSFLLLKWPFELFLVVMTVLSRCGSFARSCCTPSNLPVNFETLIKISSPTFHSGRDKSFVCARLVSKSLKFWSLSTKEKKKLEETSSSAHFQCNCPGVDVAAVSFCIRIGSLKDTNEGGRYFPTHDHTRRGF